MTLSGIFGNFRLASVDFGHKLDTWERKLEGTDQLNIASRKGIARVWMT
jgi:hypothetical protein